MSATVTTIEGERWDQLSQRVFGHPDQYDLLWAKNPDVPARIRFAPTLPAGLKLKLPIIVKTIQAESTPPWR